MFILLAAALIFVLYSIAIWNILAEAAIVRCSANKVVSKVIH